MLWYKTWLETRFKILFMLLFAVFPIPLFTLTARPQILHLGFAGGGDRRRGVFRSLLFPYSADVRWIRVSRHKLPFGLIKASTDPCTLLFRCLSAVFGFLQRDPESAYWRRSPFSPSLPAQYGSYSRP